MKHLISRRHFAKAALAIVTFAAVPSVALAKTIKRFSQSPSGKALDGFDTTAYFLKGQALDGSDVSTVNWKGAVWRFARPEDAALFQVNPEIYAPQFGGYCTRAMSLGKEVAGNPEVWRIQGEKLYVFFAARGGEVFDQAPDVMIERAQNHWDTLTLVE